MKTGGYEADEGARFDGLKEKLAPLEGAHFSETRMKEAEIANRVLAEHRSQIDYEAWGLLIAAAPDLMASKVEGPGCWFETLDGQLVWRDGSA